MEDGLATRTFSDHTTNWRQYGADPGDWGYSWLRRGIGDVALATLLDGIGLTADDTVVVLGDVIDRGPNSKGVIDRLIQLSHEVNLWPCSPSTPPCVYRWLAWTENHLESSIVLSNVDKETVESMIGATLSTNV